MTRASRWHNRTYPLVDEQCCRIAQKYMMKHTISAKYASPVQPMHHLYQICIRRSAIAALRCHLLCRSHLGEHFLACGALCSVHRRIGRTNPNNRASTEQLYSVLDNDLTYVDTLLEIAFNYLFLILFLNLGRSFQHIVASYLGTYN
jgi:hypothetical protein